MSSLSTRPPGRSANVFINYRREDSAGHAGRLFDGLSSHFPGRLFMDVDTIAPGIDFVDAIEKAVGACEVLIVVIGQDWLTLKNAAGQRRLDDPGDFVRLELETALARNIRVIPVLVQDAPMPRPEDLPPSLARLARRNAIELSDVRWAYDVDRLAQTIQGVLREGEEAPTPLPKSQRVPPVAAPERRPARPRALIFVLAALLLVTVGWISKNRFQSTASAAAGSHVTPAPAPAPANSIAAAAPSGTAPSQAPINPAPVPAPANPEPAPDLSRPVPAPARPIPRPVPVAPYPESVQAPVSPPPARPETDIRPVEPEPSPTPADSRKAPEEALQLPGVTITSPKDGTKVGKHITARGVITGLGAGQRAFLCMKNREGVTYPRGELFPGADGRWSAELDSSHHDYEIFVVVATGPAAAAALNDSGNLKEGLRAFPPPGAFIVGPVVSLDRQGKVLDILNPGRR